MDQRRIAVIGGSGFFGRAIVRELAAAGMTVRIAVRHPGASVVDALRHDHAGVEAVAADLRDERSLTAALDGAWGAVNAAGLYVESAEASFQAIHVEGARRLARLATDGGVRRLVHVSGIGADAAASSAYVRARGEGEQAVREAFPEATILRPGPLVGPGDALVCGLARVIRSSPVIPLFGDGGRRVQPLLCEDAARAVRACLQRDDTPGRIYEIAGPTVFTYRGLIETIEAALGRRRLKLPVPLAAWRLAATLLSPLPAPPVTPDMLALVARDTLASPALPGLAALGLTPTPIESRLPELLARG